MCIALGNRLLCPLTAAHAYHQHQQHCIYKMKHTSAIEVSLRGRRLNSQAKYRIYAVELKTEVNERPSMKRDCDHENNYTVLLNYYATK